MIYLLMILPAMGTIAAVNMAAGADATVIPVTVALTAAVIALDGLLAFLIRRLPERLFSYRAPLLAVGALEGRLYRLLRLRRWGPTVVPDLGCFTDFPKRRLLRPRDADYTARYLLEAVYGIVIHAVHIPAGLLILPLFPSYAVTVALPVVGVNAVLSLLPLMLLRSNLPTLVRLHEANEKRGSGAPQ